MVFWPSKIIMTSKISCLHQKLWFKSNITKPVFLLLDFFPGLCSMGFKSLPMENALVGAAIGWWTNLSHPLCFIWNSEIYSRIRKGKCKAFCVFIPQLGCATYKDEPVKIWDPVGLGVLKWKLFVLSPMQQNRSHYRFGAGSWGKQQMIEMYIKRRGDQRRRTGKGLGWAEQGRLSLVI